MLKLKPAGPGICHDAGFILGPPTLLDHHSLTGHLQAIITVLSLVNPFMCAAIFARIEAGKSQGTQLGSATKVALAVFVILTVAALVAVATTVMWLVIVLLARLSGSGSGGFVRETATRFMGLIVIAMGVQFALTGVRSFMFEPDRAAPHDTMADESKAPQHMTAEPIQSDWTALSINNT